MSSGCRRWRAVALAIACLGGCASGPGEIPPPVDVPPAFSRGGTAAVPDEWWRSFRDPVLDDLVDRALDGNLELRTVWDRLAQAEAEARLAGASLLPGVDVTANAGRSVRKTTDGSTTRTYSTNLVLGLLADYEVDLWGRVRATASAAEYDVRASVEDVRAAAITISATIAITWFRIVEQAGQIDLLDEQIRINEQILELVTLRFLRGQATAADVLRQRQLVEARRGERVQAQAAAEVLEHRLAILLGRPPAERVAERSATLPDLPELPSTGLPADLLQRRPDVLASYAAVLAADRRVAAAVADQFPRITLGGSAAWSASETRHFFDNWVAELAGGLLGPIFDGGRRSAEADRSRAVLSQRLHEYGRQILVSLGEVEDALVLEERQAQYIASLDRQIELARGAVDRIRDQYTSGAVDYLNVLDALFSYQSLQRARLGAQRELTETRISLYRALAGGWALERPDPAGGRDGR